MTFRDKLSRLSPDAQEHVLRLMGRLLMHRGDRNAETLQLIAMDSLACQIAAVFAEHGMEVEQYT